MAKGKKLSGLNDDGKPNAYWRRFKERLDNYSSTPLSSWSEENVLGHILKRYKDHSGLDFALSYSGPPTKCREIYCVQRMILNLGTDDYAVIKKYVDWVFDTYIVSRNSDLNSLAFFFTDSYILRFKALLRKESKVTRITELPEKYLSKAKELQLSITTYGDLAFAQQALQGDPDNEDYAVYREFFKFIESEGFNLGVLSEVA